MRNKLLLSAVLLLSCALFPGPPARAVEKPALKPIPKTTVKSAGAAGLRAYIDPTTGKLREPTPEEAQALSRKARAFALRPELVAITHANGMTSVDLKDAFLMDTVARRNPYGSISLGCGRQAHLPSAPAAPALEEK